MTSKKIVKLIIIILLLSLSLLAITLIYKNMILRIQTTKGCRAPNEAGCSSCLYMDKNDASCWISSTSSDFVGREELLYNKKEASSCDVNIPKCAICTKEMEQNLRSRLEKNKSVLGCDCNSISNDFDACIAKESCECKCHITKDLLIACPFVK